MNDARLPERFWAKVSVDQQSECWVWTGAHTACGYGNFKVNGKAQRAHRISYQALVGSIPEGLDMDHLCRRRDCVNPAHMEPVTRRTNTLRGVGWCAQQVVKTHCVNGHPFDEVNTYHTRNGRRACRRCNALAQQRKQKKALA